MGDIEGGLITRRSLEQGQRRRKRSEQWGKKVNSNKAVF